MLSHCVPIATGKHITPNNRFSEIASEGSRLVEEGFT